MKTDIIIFGTGNNAEVAYYYLKNDTPKALFMQYDTSMSIMDGTGCVGDHKDRNRLLIDILSYPKLDDNFCFISLNLLVIPNFIITDFISLNSSSVL